YTDTGLGENIIYCYSAWAYDERTDMYSNGFVLACGGIPPSDPSGLSISSTTNSFTLSFTKGSASNTVIRRSINTAPTTIEEGTAVYNSTGSSFTDSDPTLAKNTTYCYSIWSYNPSTAALSTSHISGCGTLSNMASPTNLTFPTVAYNSIILNWTPGTGATNTIIRRQLSTVPTMTEGVEIYTDNSNAFLDTGLESGSTYCYSLWSYDSIHDSYSDTPLSGCTTTLLPIGGSGSLLFAIDSMNGTGNGDKIANTEYASVPVEYVEVSGDTTYSTTPTIGNSTADARMLALRYKGNLTINSGVTLTPQVRKRGMFLYVDGTLTVNGTISMTARGAANVVGDRILVLNSGGSAYEIPAVGGAGGAGGGLVGGIQSGFDGNIGMNGGTAGGGGGSNCYGDGCPGGGRVGGRGGNGTSYSGGSGAGAGGSANASDIGGVGASGGSGYSAGGTGNPGGSGAPAGSSGTGGLLIIYANNITVGSSGIINANGISSVTGSCGCGCSGGCGGAASGGGSINIFYKTNLANNGSIIANGGTGTRQICCAGSGWGGNGTVRVTKYSNDSNNVSGVCGSANNAISLAVPTYLCNDGAASNISTLDPYTKLLLHMDGSNNGQIFNDQTGKSISITGNTKTVTAVKKLGSTSAYFDGSGDYLTIPDSEDWNFGTGEFTIDFWLYQLTSNSQRYITQYNSENYWQIYYDSGSSFGLSPVTGGGIAVPTSNVPLNQWVHIAFVGTSAEVILFIDGVEKGRGTRGGSYPNPTNPLRIGSFIDFSNMYDFQGYMDEIRISKSIARWTSNFTPPNAQYYYWNWNCNGLNGGSNVTCGADKY
ncbi:MAG: hypothetical protein PHW52_05495, partial [Candidatus Pacebacteria bacterium]|nr:hypothetical protein [Candidatus Paceibacterota bacterium]